MMLFLTKPNRQGSQGFTLLEMLVVVLLVSLLASLLMQGFVYMSGTYHAVERRQLRAQQQELFEGWLRDSIHGMVNGIDGQSGKNILFSGNETQFSGITFAPLTGQQTGLPVQVIWQLETEGTLTSLRYGEVALPAQKISWHTIRVWENVSSASWSYLSNGEWKNQFPTQSSAFTRNSKVVLPKAIALKIDAVPMPIELIISLHSSTQIYRAPVIEGIL